MPPVGPPPGGCSQEVLNDKLSNNEIIVPLIGDHEMQNSDDLTESNNIEKSVNNTNTLKRKTPTNCSPTPKRSQLDSLYE